MKQTVVESVTQGCTALVRSILLGICENILSNVKLSSMTLLGLQRVVFYPPEDRHSLYNHTPM